MWAVINVLLSPVTLRSGLAVRLLEEELLFFSARGAESVVEIVELPDSICFFEAFVIPAGVSRKKIEGGVTLGARGSKSHVAARWVGDITNSGGRSW